MTKTRATDDTTNDTADARSVRKPRPAPAGRTEEELDTGTNEARLVGRLTNEPVLVDLPSGDTLVTFRISVPRDARSKRPGASAGGQRVDSVPCTAWSPTLRRRISGWHAGDTVEIVGAVRCRFYQAGGATRSRVEVEATAGKIIRRAPAS